VRYPLNPDFGTPVNKRGWKLQGERKVWRKEILRAKVRMMSKIEWLGRASHRVGGGVDSCSDHFKKSSAKKDIMETKNVPHREKTGIV